MISREAQLAEQAKAHKRMMLLAEKAEILAELAEIEARMKARRSKKSFKCCANKTE